MLKREKSEELTKVFNEYYPGGHSNLRIPMQVTEHRLFIDRTEGAHLFDIDGNEYIEYNGSLGPNVLGHKHPEFTEKIKEFLDSSGTTIGSNLLFTPNDVVVAEMLRKFVPCVEQVKFTLSGTEAVQTAFRIARAYTGKNIIVRFYGQYCGWLDNVLGGAMNPDPDAKPHPVHIEDAHIKAEGMFTEGKSPWALNETFLIPWNNFEVLEKTFEKYHDEIAMIHFEGIVWNHDGLYPKPGFLEKIRELCDKYNVVMCMDEIINGFRVGLGGAQEVLGVTPDICTLGKAIGNGIPIACVGGKKEIMEVLRNGRVIAPGTFQGYGFGMAAIKACLEILSADDGAIYKKIYAAQEKLMDGLVAIADKYDIPLTISEAQGVFSALFGIPGGRRRLYEDWESEGFDRALSNEFQKYMQENGVFLMFGGRWYMHAQHSMEDIDKTLEAADKSMKALKENFIPYR